VGKGNKDWVEMTGSSKGRYENNSHFSVFTYTIIKNPILYDKLSFKKLLCLPHELE
jgi:hypothetical protein